MKDYMMKYKKITGKSVWNGSDVQDKKSWTWYMPSNSLMEIDENILRIENKKLNIDQIKIDDFRLKSIESELKKLRNSIDSGLGFQIIKGIPVKKYSYQHLRIMLWGLSLHFGQPLPQTKLGELFIDVRNEGGDVNQNMRGYHSLKHLPFHTDGGHIVGLFCLEQSSAGGLSLLASSAAIHNAILAEDPELLDYLYEGFPMDRRGAEPDGEPRLSPWNLPIFSFKEGRLSCVYDRRSSEWGMDRAGRTMPVKAIAALDFFDKLTQNQDLQLSMQLEPGDLQLVNNFSVIHSRTSFQDDADAGKLRHLLRIWIDSPKFKQNAINKLHLYTRQPLPESI